ncbi:MAG: hypothetical protein WDN00_01190 [Limisphaerales bacterium]
MNFRITTIHLQFGLVILTLMPLCGCVTKSKARADARAAYVAGQRDAYASIAVAQDTNIKVNGPVQNSNVPWVEGMTLAQAIATANYTGRGRPEEIILLRRGESATIDPRDLLNGHDVPLEPGDAITLH